MKLLSQLALLLAAAATLHADIIHLDVSPVTLGQTFTVTVSVTDLAGGSVVTFGMNPFTSNPFIASFVGATVDPLFFDDSGFFPGTAIAGDTFPPLDVGPVTLATLTFLALNPGPVTVGILSDLSDPNQGLGLNGPAPGFAPSVQDLTRSVSLVVTPEPGAAGLLAFAMGAVAVLFRMRHGRLN